MDTSGGETGGVVGYAELPEAFRTETDLFFTLPAGGPYRRLTPVDDTGGQLVEETTDGGSVLAHQIDVTRLIQGDYRYGIGGADDITRGRGPIGEADEVLFGPQVVSRVDPPSLEDLFPKWHLYLLSVTDQPIVPEGGGPSYAVVPLGGE